MENIYRDAIKMVADGAKFNVNLVQRTLKINGKPIISNGEYKGSLGIEKMQHKQVILNIEELYDRYKHSIPSARSESKRFRYFKALKEDELENDDMLFGEQRDEAQIRLELFVLIAILNNSIKWNDSQWFWQSSNDKDLIILKEWIKK